MATKGLTINSPGVPTELGKKTNTYVTVVEVDAQGKDDAGDNVIAVLYRLYESAAKYDAGDRPLLTAGFSHRATYSIAAATEISQTSIHQGLKAVLEGEGWTVTEVTE